MESRKTTKTLTDIPLKIQIAIISKLPVKQIIACKSLSKAFNKLISNPLFSRIYRTNHHNNNSSLDTIFINFYEYKPDHAISSNVVEFKRVNNNSRDITKHTCVMPERPKDDATIIRENVAKYSVWGNCCNGLMCSLKRECFNIHSFFVSNPITGDIIELPDPVKKTVMLYGLGYCQETDRYKALRVIGRNEYEPNSEIWTIFGANQYERKTEILTIGVDKHWRRVQDVGPEKLFSPGRGSDDTNPYIVALGSAIHWLVLIDRKMGYTRYICAFDMTEERVCALEMPVLEDCGYGWGVLSDKLCLGVLSDKLCFWEKLRNNGCVNVWVMDEYGIQESWTKRFGLKFSALPWEINWFRLTPLAISVEEGVILLSDNSRLMIYDMVSNSVMKVMPLSDDGNCTIPIVPDFVSFKNRRGWLTEETIEILPDLPLDIQMAITSILPLKKILACKCLSKTFNKLISDPLFSHIYRTYHNLFSLNTTFIHSYDKFSNTFVLDLVEFRRNIYDNNSLDINKLCFKSDTIEYSIWGHCNGLICFLKRDIVIYNFFVANPITGEFIELPDPVTKIVMLYGLGYCQFTDRYKALRIITPSGHKDDKNKTEILTIGVDKNWRCSVVDVSVPHNYVHPLMVAFSSALHWLVKLVPMHICAFDMTEERVHALQIPPQVALRSYGHGLGVLLDKLCYWEILCQKPYDVHIWVMDEYGVEESWTKRSVLQFPALPPQINLLRLTPLAMSIEEGVILISDDKRLMIYDMVTNSVKVMPLSKDANRTIPIVPDFVSFKNRPGWITDVYPC